MILTESAICIPDPNEPEVKDANPAITFSLLNTLRFNKKSLFQKFFYSPENHILFVIVHYQVMTPFKPHQPFVS